MNNYQKVHILIFLSAQDAKNKYSVEDSPTNVVQ